MLCGMALLPEPHQKKRKLEGLVPRQLFVPMERAQGFAFNYGTMDATLQMFHFAANVMGVSRTRLLILLGGEATNIWRTGRQRRLSQLYTMRLAYLFYLKGFLHVYIGGLYAVDWGKGDVYFNEGEPTYLLPPSAVPVEVETVQQPKPQKEKRKVAA